MSTFPVTRLPLTEPPAAIPEYHVPHQKATKKECFYVKSHPLFLPGPGDYPQEAAEIDRQKQEYLASPLETDWLKIRVVTVTHEKEVKENV